MRLLKSQLLLPCIISFVFCGPALAEDWPQWLGPRGDGISHETGLLDAWPAAGLKTLWTADVGIGFSSPIAVDGKIYFFASVGADEVLWAFDAASGKVLWKQAAADGWAGDRPGTRATPLVEGQFIYTYGGGGDLICRNLADGHQVWAVDVLKKLGSAPDRWGQASSPLIVGKCIIVQSGLNGPAAAAFDKTTGELVWKSTATDGAYTHPILIQTAKTSQLIVLATKEIISLNPDTGATLWSLPCPAKYDINATTPIYRDGRLFISSNLAQGSLMLQVTDTGATKIWENKSLSSKYQPVILDGDYLYLNSVGQITCLAWSDGSVKWTADKTLNIKDGGSILRYADRLIALADDGNLFLLKATPTGLEKISQINHFVEGPQVWSMPLIYQGRLYVKGKENLVCSDLSGK